MKIKKITPSAYFLIVVIVVMVVFFVTSAGYDALKVKLMPMAMSGFTVIMALVALVIDLKAGEKSIMPTDDEGDVIEDEEILKTPLSAYFKSFAWMAWAVLGVYFLGFIVAFPLWIAVYMGKNGYALWIGIVTGAGYMAIIYLIFTTGFQVDLYPGLIGDLILRLF
jgi:hypothetical protein